MSFQAKIELIREKIINRSIIIASIFSAIAVFSSLLRISDIGIQPAMIIHVALAVLLLALLVFRNFIGTNKKTHAFLILFTLVPIIGIINFRIAGGTYYILFVIIIATMSYGFRGGLIYSIAFVLVYLLVAYLHRKNILHPAIDFNTYTNNTSAWLSTLSGYVFVFIVLINVASLYYNLFMSSLKESWAKTEELKNTNTELRKAEKRYRSLFEGSVDGIILIDNNLCISDCNQSYLNMVGFKLSELLGNRYNERLPNENFDWDKYFIELSGREGIQKVTELEISHKNGSPIPVQVTPYMIEGDDGMFLWGVIRDLRNIKELERQVFSTMISAEEKERERYAKELHDGLGPLLSTSLIYINAAKQEKDRAVIEDYAQRAYDIIKEATRVVKEISNNLSPVILAEYGIAQAIRSFIEKARLATPIEFSIEENNSSRMSSIVESTIYRILVELINNSIKYSKAKKVKIIFKLEDHQYTVKFTDNGEGFDYKKAIENNTGFGLLNLENRIKKIGGKYNYQTSPGNGVNVTILLKQSLL